MCVRACLRVSLEGYVLAELAMIISTCLVLHTSSSEGSRVDVAVAYGSSTPKVPGWACWWVEMLQKTVLGPSSYVLHTTI